MSSQKPTAFEQAVLASLTEKAGLVAAVLETWADLPADSVQFTRSLIDATQLCDQKERNTRPARALSQRTARKVNGGGIQAAHLRRSVPDQQQANRCGSSR